MKRKPWSLIVIAFCHIFAPFGNIIFNALTHGRSLKMQWFYWYHFMPKYLLAIYIVLPVLAGIFILICKRWSYWGYIGCLMIILASNIYSLTTNFKWISFLAFLMLLVIDLLIVGYFVVPAVQKVYFDPRLRWWEASPRYHLDTFGHLNGQKSFLKNWGQGGLFATMDHDLLQDQDVKIELCFEGISITLRGRVVYKSTGAASLGYGIQFLGVSSKDQIQIDKIVSILHKRGKIVTERLPGKEDGFIPWFKKLLKNGEGLFPRIRA